MFNISLLSFEVIIILKYEPESNESQHPHLTLYSCNQLLFSDTSLTKALFSLGFDIGAGCVQKQPAAVEFGWIVDFESNPNPLFTSTINNT